MKHNKSNPLLEFDVFKSPITGWYLFISLFRFSFSLQLSPPEKHDLPDYLDGNYSVGNLTEEQDAKLEEEWEETSHKLEGLYYSHFLSEFLEIKFTNNEFHVNSESGWYNGMDIVSESAIIYNLGIRGWEQVISLEDS